MTKFRFLAFIVCYYLMRFILQGAGGNGRDYFIDFLNVGQGDAVLVRTPHNKVLIDAGPDNSLSYELSNYFWNPFCSFDFGFVTHAHADHYYGFTRIAKLCQPKLITFNDVDQLQTSSQVFNQLLQENKINKTFLGDEYFFDGVRIKILYPRSVRDLNLHLNDLNFNSIVMLLEYGDFEALLLGDAQKETLATINWDDIKDQIKPPLEVIKVAHHGAINGFYLPMYDTLKPLYCVISVGKDNTFGHPNPDVVQQLESSGCTVLRTDVKGTIEMKL